MSDSIKGEGLTAPTVKPSDQPQDTSRQTITETALKRNDGKPRPRLSKVGAWLQGLSTINAKHRPFRPSVVKALAEISKPNANTLLTIDQARDIVRYLAAHDDNFFLAAVVPDESSEWRPLCICDSRKITIAVPSCGTLLGSLVSELALLHVRSLEDACDDRAYQRRKTAIRKTVLAGALEVAR